MDGLFKDSDSGLVHQSEKKLTFQEVLVIAEAAKSSHYFDRHVQWWVSSTPFGFFLTTGWLSSEIFKYKPGDLL